MQIEEGKYYKTRSGEKVGPMLDYGTTLYGYEAMTDGKWLWRARDGMNYPDRDVSDQPDMDLIAPWPAETGTLSELGVKPGDVVKHGDGSTYEVRMDGDVAKLWWLTEYGDTPSCQGWGVSVGKSYQVYTVVTRAHGIPSPIRTVTRTTTEIVPGVYGAIEVYEDEHGCMSITMDCSPCVAELTDAITTLTTIRDAMAQNAAPDGV